MKLAVFGALAVGGTVCAPIAPAAAQTTSQSGAPDAIYVADLHDLNSSVTGTKAAGEARFVVHGDTLTITVNMRGMPPGIMHWQHFHGFKDNRAATCPTAAADANHDGIIDLIETSAASGETMVPFNADPAAMQVASNTYPTASSKGTYQYHATVSLKDLEAGFAKALGGQNLDLDRRVVFVHGVPPAAKLPPTVASLGTIPASVTLPIACGKIERTRH